MFKKASVILIALVSIIAFGGTVKAETFAFSGNIAAVRDLGGLSGAISAGDIFSGSFSYDLSTPDSNTLFTTVGDYYHNTAPYGVSIDIGGLNFRTDPTNTNFLFEVINDHLDTVAGTVKDGFVFHSFNNIGADIISWQGEDITGTAISDTSLFTSFDLSLWVQSFGLTISGSGFDLKGVVTSIETVTPVPEPSTLLLLGSGLVGLGFVRRRFKA